MVPVFVWMNKDKNLLFLTIILLYICRRFGFSASGGELKGNPVKNRELSP